MQQQGPRYKTRAFTLWSRLCLYVSFRCRQIHSGRGSNPPLRGLGLHQRPLHGSSLQFGNDDDLDAGFDVAVDLHGHLVSTEGFYGLVQAYAAPVEADAARLLDRVGDVGRGDGAEEPLVLAGAGFDRDNALVQDAGDLLGPLGEAPVPLLALLHGAAGLFERARGRHLGEAARDEEVAHVAAAHVYDVAALPDLLHVALQYYLQGIYLPTT